MIGVAEGDERGSYAAFPGQFLRGAGKDKEWCDDRPAIAAEAFFVLRKAAMMMGLHSATKGQREVVRQLVHSVLLRDMSTFNPERFKEWIKAMDTNFRKVGLTLTFRIHDREVQFAIKEIRSGRTMYHFNSATYVRFGDRDVIMTVDRIAGIKM
jgi:hypothetical protein